ncbi:MAG: hypothetical protein DDT27_01178 [Dehalococcoidia bacterium]|nr:hypothetical protein [Chloroflexota bacterium]MBT9160742.1 hypothetical protein [Chloroflexota bacterium]MBT9162619.1 hypothetical protein [Chloroflexota bacterium]
MVYYPVPLHKMKVFDKRCRMPGGLAEAERAAKEVLSLPIEPLMTEDEISYVCETINKGGSCKNPLAEAEITQLPASENPFLQEAQGQYVKITGGEANTRALQTCWFRLVRVRGKN